MESVTLIIDFFLLLIGVSFCAAQKDFIEITTQNAADTTKTSREMYQKDRFQEDETYLYRISKEGEVKVFKNPQWIKREIFYETCQIDDNLKQTVNIKMPVVYEKMNFSNAMYEHEHELLSYNEKQWTDIYRLKVFVVPFSHTDTGSWKSLDYDFEKDTKAIFDTLIELNRFPKMRFIWNDVMQLDEWWMKTTQENRAEFERLITKEIVEIVSGGWVKPDEATSHWSGLLHQLTEGHQWLARNLPTATFRNGFNIETYGLSSTMAMLLRESGIRNAVVSNVHYAVKHQMALQRWLEFQWRQVWDVGFSDLFLHIEPFNSDCTNSCGPQEDVHCQFDFSTPRCRTANNTPVTDQDIQQKSEILLNRYRLKAQFYQTNYLLVPIGCDYTLHSISDLKRQYDNLETIFGYINSRANEFHTQIAFTTLNEYFKTVEQYEYYSSLPTLSGDFITYADSNTSYFSGYFTSNSFYNRLERILMSHLRAVEILYIYCGHFLERDSIYNIPKILFHAQRTLATLQRYDKGITGTARLWHTKVTGKSLVTEKHMLEYAMGKSVNLLLGNAMGVSHPMNEFYVYDDFANARDFFSEKHILLQTRSEERIVLFNQLTFTRKEVVIVLVSSPTVNVLTSSAQIVKCQVNPIWNEKTNTFEPFFQVGFVAEVNALSVRTYILKEVKYAFERDISQSHVHFHNCPLVTGSPPGFRRVEFFRKLEEITLFNSHVRVEFQPAGFIRQITVKEHSLRMNLTFARYRNTNSDAYVFKPKGRAKRITFPKISALLMTGNIWSTVTFYYLNETDRKVPPVIRSFSIFNSGGIDSLGLHVTITLDTRNFHHNDFVMRLNTDLKSEGIFFTDENGFQIIKRKRMEGIPIAGNYYPISSMVFIEDLDYRVSVIMASANGATSLRTGQLEIMLDRNVRSNKLEKTVLTDIPHMASQHFFRILVEPKRKTKDCSRTDNDDLSAFPSVAAHVTSETLLNPLKRLIAEDNSTLIGTDEFTRKFTDPGVDITVPTFRSAIQFGDAGNYIGLVLHRQHFDSCFMTADSLVPFSYSQGKVSIEELFPEYFQLTIYESTITFRSKGNEINGYYPIYICPMELKAYLIEVTYLNSASVRAGSACRLSLPPRSILVVFTGVFYLLILF